MRREGRPCLLAAGVDGQKGRHEQGIRALGKVLRAQGDAVLPLLA